MQRARRKASVALLTSLLCACLLTASATFNVWPFIGSTAHKDLHTRVQSYRSAYNVPGLAYGLVNAGDIEGPWTLGVSPASGLAIHAHSIFRIASLSKPLTAVAVLQLVSNGKISLDQTIAQLVNVPGELAYNITVRMLLDHSSGIRSNLFAGSYLKNPDTSISEFVMNALTRPPASPPGTYSYYDNANYMILGEIIAHICACPYPDYVYENILAPLGMQDTSFGEPHFASELAFGPDELAVDKFGGAGGWYSSIHDLLRFLSDWDKRLDIKAALLEEIAKPVAVPAPDGTGRTYGLGWHLWSSPGSAIRIVKRHFGSLPGAFAQIAHCQSGNGWVILANERSPNGHLDVRMDAELFSIFIEHAELPCASTTFTD